MIKEEFDTYEYEGKRYIVAEDFMGSRSAEFFYTGNLDYFSYLGITPDEAESNLKIKSDLEKLDCDYINYFGDDYLSLLEVDENNHVIGVPEDLFYVGGNKIVNSQTIIDEFINRVKEINLQVDYDFNDNALHKQFNAMLKDVKEGNERKAFAISNGIKKRAEKYGEKVFERDDKNFVLAEEYLEKNENNKDFRPENAGKLENDSLKMLVEIDNRYNAIGASDYVLNEKTNEISHVQNIDISDWDKQKENLEKAVTVTKYREDLTLLKKEIENFIDDKVIDKEKERLKPDYQSMGFGEEFVENLKDKLLEERKNCSASFNHLIDEFDYDLTKDCYYFSPWEKIDSKVILEPCINTAVTEKTEDLLHASETEKFYEELDTSLTNDEDFIFLKNSIEYFISNEVIDKNEERLKPDYQSIGISLGIGEIFIEDLKDKLLEEANDCNTTFYHFIKKFDLSSDWDNRAVPFVLETCINTAVTEKTEDLLHAFEMEELQQEVENAVYEDVKDEIENADYADLD